MSRPTKSVYLLNNHLSIAEIEAREQAEASSFSGIELQEWPEIVADPIAHEHFSRIHTLLQTIGKADALFESGINRYCMLQAECSWLQMDSHHFKEMAAKLDEQELGLTIYLRARSDIERLAAATNRNLNLKRRMLFDIEKEFGLTIQGALRAIPKRTPQEQEEPDPMELLLDGPKPF